MGLISAAFRAPCSPGQRLTAEGGIILSQFRHPGIADTWAQRLDFLGSSPTFTVARLCDLGQVTRPLCVICQREGMLISGLRRNTSTLAKQLKELLAVGEAGQTQHM